MMLWGGGSSAAQPSGSSPLLAEAPAPPLFNQSFIRGVHTDLDVDDVDAVLRYVFGALPDEVYVYPTENYYYFQFYAHGTSFWGNFRFGVEERDRGEIFFVYWEYLDDPQGPDDGASWSKRLGVEQGVYVEKRAPLRYAVTLDEKTVLFQLNTIEQTPPNLFALADDEVFVSRTFDESGVPFFLIYGKTQRHFMFMLNEEDGFPGIRDTLSSEIIVDRLSGFAFHVDSTYNDRKILIGVYAQNTRRNNYWDGPFDQLADNYIHPQFLAFVQEAYPYTKGRIDKYGIFTDQVAMRLAISPYHEYWAREELIELVDDCKEVPPDEFYPCITYDYKTSL